MGGYGRYGSVMVGHGRDTETGMGMGEHAIR